MFAVFLILAVAGTFLMYWGGTKNDPWDQYLVIIGLVLATLAMTVLIYEVF